MAILILADSLGLLSIFLEFLHFQVNAPISLFKSICFPVVSAACATFYAVTWNVKSCNFYNPPSGMQYAQAYFLPVINCYNIQERCAQRI